MKLMSVLLSYSRRTVILAIIAGIVSGACNAALLAIIHRVLTSSGGTSPNLLWGFLALWFVLPASRIASQVTLSHLVQTAIYDLRMHLSRQMLAAPLRQLEEIGPHRLFATLNDDVQAISNALVSIPTICMQMTVLLASLVYLGWLSWPVLIGVVIFMSVGMFTFQFAVGKAGRYLRLAREDHDALFRHFRALIDGNKELKLHRRRRHSFMERVLQTTAKSFRRHNVIGGGIQTAAAGMGQILFFLLIGLLIFGVPAYTNTSAQVLTGYVLLLLFIMTPIEVLNVTVPTLSRASIALQKVESLGLSLAAKTTEKEAAETAAELPAWETVELRGIAHTYYREADNSHFTLGPIDLTLTPGELVFITGGNGSGKTTLAKLLIGLYAPEEGELRINGEPVTDENRDWYRQHFTVVFSDFFLFDSLLGLEAPKLDEKAREYLVKLQLNHKLEVKEGVLSTTQLSQGQRKRLALLTAYLEDRSIYLFDEWAADQDPTFKQIFYHSLLPELKARGKTVIVISHDDRYYDVADRIIKLADGKLEYDQDQLVDRERLSLEGGDGHKQAQTAKMFS
ncbi:MAG TPA: cyclic peptide export ABC transporter [Pyrinomonadaceae bacterium]|nr:cyclic peptide export ABC transporter [Pyrinomonadaceae bacterium]